MQVNIVKDHVSGEQQVNLNCILFKFQWRFLTVFWEKAEDNYCFEKMGKCYSPFARGPI